MALFDKVSYDFEDYALHHGIPDLRDPLPYRQGKSIFGKNDQKEQFFLTSAKHDPRLRTVVCRHWLRDLCMKGTSCEFLHQYDLSKMPVCHQPQCPGKECPFRHIRSEEQRSPCVFYSQGFCIHGARCHHPHVQQDRADLPLVADFTQGIAKHPVGIPGAPSRHVASQRTLNYKTSLCKHFLHRRDCPFGDGCHFAHGQEELRGFPRTNDA